MQKRLFAAVAALFQLSASLPLDQGTSLLQRHDEPCNRVREHVAKWMSDNNIGMYQISRVLLMLSRSSPHHPVPKNYTDPVQQALLPAVPAAPIQPSVAYACLKSVPLHQDTALAQLDFLRPLFEWQSTVDYLRDPPQGYLSEGVDLIRGFDDIAAKLRKEKGGSYANEFDYLADLYTLTTVRPRDFHLTYSTLLMQLFTFHMKAQFVAVSEDGLALPKIYLHGNMLPQYTSRGTEVDLWSRGHRTCSARVHAVACVDHRRCASNGLFAESIGEQRRGP